MRLIRWMRLFVPRSARSTARWPAARDTASRPSSVPTSERSTAATTPRGRQLTHARLRPRAESGMFRTAALRSLRLLPRPSREPRQNRANRGQPRSRSEKAVTWASSLVTAHQVGRPRQDSNLRTRLRRPMLYPLSYEGREGQGSAPALGGRTGVASVAGLCMCCREGYVGCAYEADHDHAPRGPRRSGAG
jgi:hypothetical protein